MFGGLHIHVFVIADIGQLGPERDVQGQGHFKGTRYIRMGMTAMAVVSRLPGMMVFIGSLPFFGVGGFARSVMIPVQVKIHP